LASKHSNVFLFIDESYEGDKVLKSILEVIKATTLEITGVVCVFFCRFSD